MKPQLPGQYEQQPNLKDLIRTEARVEGFNSVKEHYDWLRDSALLSPRFERFYRDFTFEGDRLVPKDSWSVSIDADADIFLRRRLNFKQLLYLEDYTRQTKENILNRTSIETQWTLPDVRDKFTSDELLSRLWATLSISFVENKHAQDCWSVLRADYFDQKEQRWLDTPKWNNPDNLFVGPTTELMAIFVEREIGIQPDSDRLQDFQAGHGSLSWLIDTRLMEILVLEQAGQFQVALDKYKQLYRAGWYDKTSQVWRHEKVGGAQNFFLHARSATWASRPAWF